MNWFEEFFGNYQMQFVYLIRIIFAGICGTALGWERMLREKEAGIRTHLILAVGAALITCVSLSFSSDSSRIAAQIVSGIGFIGAGMIMFRGEALHGLTTATGIWTTAGIGMCAANGMYILAALVTIIVILAQIILHTHPRKRRAHVYKSLHVEFVCNDETVKKIKQQFGVKYFSRLKVESQGDRLIANAVIRTYADCDILVLTKVMTDNPDILNLERLDVNAF